MNMKTMNYERKVGNLFAILGNPFRIKIVVSIGLGEACVCHLESVLEKRQAYISQHLMALRDAGILETRREGKFVFYRLSNPQILDVIEKAGLAAGIDEKDLSLHGYPIRDKDCICPHCTGDSINKNTGI